MMHAVQEAMRHTDKPGAGAKKRKKLRGKTKRDVVMKEWKRGTLHSGKGKNAKKVPKDRPDWAYAIAMSEAGMSKKKKARKKRR